jgi:hypothetical protein
LAGKVLKPLLLVYIVILALIANGRYLILEFRFGVGKVTDRLAAYLAQPVGFGIGSSPLDLFIGQNRYELRYFLHYHLPLKYGAGGLEIREDEDNASAYCAKWYHLNKFDGKAVTIQPGDASFTLDVPVARRKRNTDNDHFAFAELVCIAGFNAGASQTDIFYDTSVDRFKMRKDNLFFVQLACRGSP